jgi:hypothetical protein
MALLNTWASQQDQATLSPLDRLLNNYIQKGDAPLAYLMRGDAQGLLKDLNTPKPVNMTQDMTNAALNLNPVMGLIGALAPAKYVGKTLEGMPNIVNVGGKSEQFGTDQRLVDIANEYSANRGLLYNPLERYAQVDVERAKRIANEYEKMANNPQALPTKKSYDALIDETQAQYEALKKAGYKFEFMPKSGDPYGNPRNAINDLVQNKHLYVLPTESGFGGTRAKEASKLNPLLQKTDEKWDGKPVLANDMFRAVHDVFGHAKHGVGFRATGEENAFQSHARMFSPEALPAAASETRGQNSWVNFGPYSELNRTANPVATQYAEQKTGLMPAWTWLEGLLR